MSTRLGGWAALGATAALSLLGIAGCVQYFEGEVQGFVRDEVTEEGINGATVRIYYDGADDESYQLTFTQTNVDDGFFIFRRIVWSTEHPWFGDEGDLTDVRVTVEHEDYQPFDTTVRLVSGAASSVGDLYLTRAFYESGTVEGSLVDAEADLDGEHPGLNGLTVKLYVPDTLITDEATARAWVAAHDPEQVATTATLDGDPGHYAFTDVRWQIPDRLPEGGEDERGTPWNVILTAEDGTIFDALFAPVEILSGEVGVELDDLAVVKRRYEGALEGWAVDVGTGDGINGISVDVYVPGASVVDDDDAAEWVDTHDPDASGTTRAEGADDGYFLIEGVGWEEDDEPTAEHPRQPVIVVLDGGAWREERRFLDAGGDPVAELVSTRTVDVGTTALSRTTFAASAEGWVRREVEDAATGVNGVEVFLYYDADDPDLSELGAFDPEAVDFSDRTTTTERDLGGATQPGYFRFDNLGWDDEDGGSLSGGRDELTVVVFSRGADFSDLPGNTDPTWQRFTLVSKVDTADSRDVNTLPPLPYRPTRFTGDVEGYVRRVEGDRTTGASGVTLRLYYEEEDADLSGLTSFDPDAAQWVDTVTTREDDKGAAGWFTFTQLSWRDPDGPSLPPDRDQLTLILQSDEVDFSGFPGNTDPTWQRFTITSGEVAAVLPDLPYDPKDFTASAEGWVRSLPGDVATGINGVPLSLWFDPDDPHLERFTTFDPATVTFQDRTTTGSLTVGDETREGHFAFADLLWRNPAGGSLGGGRDELSVILYSPSVDFSGFAGNTSPTWQRFTLVSAPGGNTLPDLTYAP